jgi:hypothetical protein
MEKIKGFTKKKQIHLVNTVNWNLTGGILGENRVLDAETVKDVFITEDPLFGTPLCIPYGKGQQQIKNAPSNLPNDEKH